MGGLTNFSFRRSSGCRKQRGVMLIETLMAVLVFIIGVLGIIGLQAKMVKNVGETKYRADAAYLVNQVVGQMWVDQAHLASYDTAHASAYANRDNWKTVVANTLPGVPNNTPTITVGANNIITINITWQPAGQSEHRYTFSTQILGRI